MIKEVLQQLEPLDAQIDALCSRADDAEMAIDIAAKRQVGLVDFAAGISAGVDAADDGRHGVVMTGISLVAAASPCAAGVAIPITTSFLSLTNCLDMV